MIGVEAETLPTSQLRSGPSLEAGAESLGSHHRRIGALPSTSRAELIAQIEASGLLGRGGAGFPVGRKWRSVAQRASGGKAVVLANGAEGEPLSLKDRSLMASRPHLVIDGALLAARAVGAEEIIFYVGAEHRAAEAALHQALAQRSADVRGRARLVRAPSGYVSGEESAAVHFVEAGDARPTNTPPRPFEQGIHGWPTLVQNVESLALAALIARYGDRWYRDAGTGNSTGLGLFTIGGAVNRPGVRELPHGSTLGAAATAAGGLHRGVHAVLLGGYFGTWAGLEEAWELRLDQSSLRAKGFVLGCGVVHFLHGGTCGVEASARIATYLASQSARQCGPCVFGLSAIAEAARRLASRSPLIGDLARIRRWSDQLAGRGSCKHPDGAVAMLSSALRVFAEDFAAHQQGRCVRAPVMAEVA